MQRTGEKNDDTLTTEYVSNALPQVAEGFLRFVRRINFVFLRHVSVTYYLYAPSTFLDLLVSPPNDEPSYFFVTFQSRTICTLPQRSLTYLFLRRTMSLRISSSRLSHVRPTYTLNPLKNKTSFYKKSLVCGILIFTKQFSLYLLTNKGIGSIIKAQKYLLSFVEDLL